MSNRYIVTRSISLLLLLAVPQIFAQGVFRWVDAEGLVHYGEAPPGHARDVKNIELHPGPSDEQIKQAAEVAEQTQQMADQYTSDRLQREAEEQARLQAEAEKRAAEAPQQDAEKTAESEKDKESSVIIINCPNGLVRNGKCINNKPNLPIDRPTDRPKPENPIWKPVTPAELRQSL